MAEYALIFILVAVTDLLGRWAFLPARYLPGNRARTLQVRLFLRLHPGKGFATIVGLHLRWGRLAALRRSRRIRPSLPLWLRALVPGGHCVFLGRAHWRHGLRVPLEEHVLVMAPPRTGKTAFLADVILRYPGPVLSTTTKADVFALTAAVRALRGPVHVFNPQLIGGVASTFAWSPVEGCQDPATAIRRADAFAFAVSREGVEDGTFWSSKASDYLRGFFHAAALGGYDMRAVAAWASGADPRVPERILAEAGAHQWALTLAELRSEAHKTAATVRMVMSRALSFMADPALAASVLPAPGRRVRRRLVPGRAGHRLPDRRVGRRGRPGRPAVRRDGVRDPLRRRHCRAGVGVRAAGPAAADGPGRGHPDLPRPAAVVAVGLRRQGHPGRRRRARRGPARRTVGRPRPPGRPGHLLGQGVPARHHRHHHPAGGQHPVRRRLVEAPRPGPRQPPPRRDPRHDPPAAHRDRPGHPRRQRPRHRPAAPRLEQPRLPPRPPPHPRPGSLLPWTRTTSEIPAGPRPRT